MFDFLKLQGGLSESLTDALDEFYLKHLEADYSPLKLPAFPPRRLRTAIGHPTLMLYACVGQEFAAYLKLLGGLKAEHQVLDVGCGCGRIAGFLTSTIRAPGRYEGFDINPELTADATRRISSLNPRFRFQAIELYNSVYNKAASAKDTSLVFPYPDGEFDLVFLTSVFTHMLPGGFKNYAKEIARVLKPGGRCLSTMFLFQNAPQAGTWTSNGAREALLPMPSEEDSASFQVSMLDHPEAMVAFDLDYVDRVQGALGMKRRGEPHWGAWSGNPEFLSYQDVLVHEKEG